MKTVSEFESQRLKKNSDITELLIFLSILAAGISMFCIGIYAELIAGVLVLLSYFGLLGICFAALAVHLRALDRFLVDRRAGYWKYLDSLPLTQLRLATMSPELDKDSRESVTEYLSAHYPGWSLQAETEVSNA